ncbi:MAG: DUF262 domain-containing protein [Solirubrobacteraceae bacterium]|nr:DUF262 domain-containing protein [Solirubrobacteraceae bacterium]
MPYETPITIKQALERIHATDYVLPAIQREFVWGPDRITRLFDSLMRGYPIGGFLLWKLQAETVGNLGLFRFLDKYSEYDRRHNDPLVLPEPRPLHAVLDGQQRLTAINVGLRGTFAYRLPRRWANKPESYPPQTLHLELCSIADDTDEEGYGEGVRYRFEFFEKHDVLHRNTENTHWFPVPDVLGLESVVDALPRLNQAGLSQEALEPAMKTLERLRQAVHADPVVAAHVEEDQDLDRVLDIFIRVNSGGMTLSSSDLLLSIATAQWKERDARESIHGLVDELNSTGHGFAFTKDLVLKASLVLTDAGDIRFKASNINAKTMAVVEEKWDGIEKALKLTAKVLDSFGFSSMTLTAHSVAIPLADYFHQRGLGESFVSSKEHKDDRAAMRSWVLRSLLKPGVWGSGLDTLLTSLRRQIREHGVDRFPVLELEATMAGRGKALTFTPEEIDTLAETRYGGRSFSILAVLYPGFDGTKAFHVDHVFPRARFTRPALSRAGLSDTQIEACIERRDGLPNLQLLEGGTNTSKQAAMPAGWLVDHFGDDAASRELYVAGHHLEGLPDGLEGFLEFYDRRRQRIRDRLAERLGVTLPEAGASADN